MKIPSPNLAFFDIIGMSSEKHLLVRGGGTTFSSVVFG
jgi:hypothetical protein